MHYELHVTLKGRRPPYGWAKVFQPSDYRSLQDDDGLVLILTAGTPAVLGQRFTLVSNWNDDIADIKSVAVEARSLTSDESREAFGSKEA
jgi:hypothetical protein